MNQDAESGRIDCEHLRKLSNLDTTRVDKKREGKKRETRRDSDQFQHVRFESALTLREKEEKEGRK